MDIRMERDSLGEMDLGEEELHGIHTRRALENFGECGGPTKMELVRAVALVKKACALVNKAQGDMPAELADVIAAAATEVIEGKFDDNFPLVVWQTGSGTQSNMNANEVISNRAIEILGGELGSKKPVHPNDHVNMGQSSNDTFPTAMHVAIGMMARDVLIPGLTKLAEALEVLQCILHRIVHIEITVFSQAPQWDELIKTRQLGATSGITRLRRIGKQRVIGLQPLFGLVGTGVLVDDAGARVSLPGQVLEFGDAGIGLFIGVIHRRHRLELGLRQMTMLETQ